MAEEVRVLFRLLHIRRMVVSSTWFDILSRSGETWRPGEVDQSDGRGSAEVREEATG